MKSFLCCYGKAHGLPQPENLGANPGTDKPFLPAATEADAGRSVASHVASSEQQLPSDGSCVTPTSDEDIQALQHGSPQQKAAAAYLLERRASSDPALLQSLREQAGLFGTLVSLMNVEGLPVAIQNAADLLFLLIGPTSMGSDGQWHRQAVNSQVVEASIAVLHVGMLQAILSACLLLSRLLKLREAANRAVDAGGHLVLMQLLHHKHKQLKRAALVCLYYLGADDTPSQDLLETCGLLPVLVPLCCDTHYDVRKEALQVLKLLCQSGRCCRAAEEAGARQVLNNLCSTCADPRTCAIAKAALVRLDHASGKGVTPSLRGSSFMSPTETTLTSPTSSPTTPRMSWPASPTSHVPPLNLTHVRVADSQDPLQPKAATANAAQHVSPVPAHPPPHRNEAGWMSVPAPDPAPLHLLDPCTCTTNHLSADEPLGVAAGRWVQQRSLAGSESVRTSLASRQMSRRGTAVALVVPTPALSFSGVGEHYSVRSSQAGTCDQSPPPVLASKQFPALLPKDHAQREDRPRAWLAHQQHSNDEGVSASEADDDDDDVSAHTTSTPPGSDDGLSWLPLPPASPPASSPTLSGSHVKQQPSLPQQPSQQQAVAAVPRLQLNPPKVLGPLTRRIASALGAMAQGSSRGPLPSTRGLQHSARTARGGPAPPPARLQPDDLGLGPQWAAACRAGNVADSMVLGSPVLGTTPAVTARGYFGAQDGVQQDGAGTSRGKPLTARMHDTAALTEQGDAGQHSAPAAAPLQAALGFQPLACVISGDSTRDSGDSRASTRAWWQRQQPGGQQGSTRVSAAVAQLEGAGSPGAACALDPPQHLQGSWAAGAAASSTSLASCTVVRQLITSAEASRSRGPRPHLTPAQPYNPAPNLILGLPHVSNQAPVTACPPAAVTAAGRQDVVPGGQRPLTAQVDSHMAFRLEAALPTPTHPAPSKAAAATPVTAATAAGAAPSRHLQPARQAVLPSMLPVPPAGSDSSPVAVWDMMAAPAVPTSPIPHIRHAAVPGASAGTANTTTSRGINRQQPPPLRIPASDIPPGSSAVKQLPAGAAATPGSGGVVTLRPESVPINSGRAGARYAASSGSPAFMRPTATALARVAATSACPVPDSPASTASLHSTSGRLLPSMLPGGSSRHPCGRGAGHTSGPSGSRGTTQQESPPVTGARRAPRYSRTTATSAASAAACDTPTGQQAATHPRPSSSADPAPQALPSATAPQASRLRVAWSLPATIKHTAIPSPEKCFDSPDMVTCDSPDTLPAHLDAQAHRQVSLVCGASPTRSVRESLDDLMELAAARLGDFVLSGTELRICQDADGQPVMLGQGEHGTVFRGTLHSVDEVAVKVAKEQLRSRAELDRFVREVELLRRLHHRNIVQAYGVRLRPGTPCLVTELMKGGDVYHALKNHPSLMKWESLGHKVAMDTALGLNHLHRQTPPLVHRALKSPNVLLSEEGVAKIADVGVCRAGQRRDMLSAQSGNTSVWAAPEGPGGGTPACDMFSYGVIVWELVTGADVLLAPQPPLARAAGHQAKGHHACALAGLPDSAPAVARRIFESCTALDPSVRPTAAMVVGWLREAEAAART